MIFSCSWTFDLLLVPPDSSLYSPISVAFSLLHLPRVPTLLFIYVLPTATLTLVLFYATPVIRTRQFACHYHLRISATYQQPPPQVHAEHLLPRALPASLTRARTGYCTWGRGTCSALPTFRLRRWTLGR